MSSELNQIQSDDKSAAARKKYDDQIISIFGTLAGSVLGAFQQAMQTVSSNVSQDPDLNTGDKQFLSDRVASVNGHLATATTEIQDIVGQ